MPFIYNFEADTNVENLVSAVKKILASHRSVNVHFELQEDEIALVANANAEIDVPVKIVDENQFASLKSTFVQPFKLSNAPLYRLMVVKTEKRVALFVDFHHLIFDGASTNLFLSNLKTLLEGGTIEPEKFTYFDYIAEEPALIERNRNFFADMLKDFESASEIKICDQPLDLNLINDYCQKNKVTPANLCLAVLG